MNEPSFTNAANSNAAIIVDEIGIEIGILGDFRLKTAYRPIFRRLDGMQIEPFAVEGSIIPYLKGRAVGAEDFAATVSEEKLHSVFRLANTLSCRNLRNLGADSLGLVVDTSLSDVDSGEDWLGIVEQSGVEPERFICAIAAASLLDRHDLVEHTLTLRAAGVGIAIRGFGMGPWDIACMQAVRPDIVCIDARWFKRVASNISAAKLLVPLVAGLHDQGTDVLIEGIDIAAELQIALDCGADLFLGDLMGGPALCGSDVDLGRRPIGRLLGDDRVVSLFG